MPPPSTWNLFKRKEISSCIFELNTSSRISEIEAQTLSKFLYTNSLILKVADKNLGWVLMDKEWYIHEVNKHLSDEKTYKLTYVTPEVVKESLKSLLNKLSTWKLKELDWLTHGDCTFPEFYILPKVHKTPITTRPVVPNINSPCTRTSKFIDKKLKPMLKLFPWILPGTKEFVNILETTVFCMDDPVLMSADVVSLYTCIPIDVALRKFKAFRYQWTKWDKKHIEFPYSIMQWNDILTLLKWVLENNIFTFGSKTYLQTQGVAMGTNCSPTFANVYLGIEEFLKFILHPKSDNIPICYKRYIDDSFMIVERKNLLETQTSFNEMAPKYIKFTFEVGTEIPFLDLKIRLGKKDSLSKNFQLEFIPYEKPINKHVYPSPLQNYPDSYKFSWITGENIRLLRNSSTKKAFCKAICKFKKELVKRNYIRNIFEKFIIHKWCHRPKFLLNINPKPFNLTTVVVDYSPHWEFIKEKLKKILILNGYSGIVAIIKQGRSTSVISNNTMKKLLADV